MKADLLFNRKSEFQIDRIRIEKKFIVTLSAN